MTLGIQPKSAANILVYHGTPGAPDITDGFTLQVNGTTTWLTAEEAKKIADYLQTPNPSSAAVKP